YFEKLELLINENTETYNLFLKWLCALDCACYCDDSSYNLYFDFYMKYLSGQQKPKLRWKRVLSVIDSNIGEILGRIYVSKYFDEESKKLALDMTQVIFKQFGKRIERLKWMSNETKQKALEKLDKVVVKIGYP